MMQEPSYAAVNEVASAPADETAEKVFTLADAYLAGFSAGSKVQKAIDETPDGSVKAEAPRKAVEEKADLTPTALLGEKEDLADAAVEWAVQYLTQGDEHTHTPTKATGGRPSVETYPVAESSLHPILVDFSRDQPVAGHGQLQALAEQRGHTETGSSGEGKFDPMVGPEISANPQREDTPDLDLQTLSSAPF